MSSMPPQPPLAGSAAAAQPLHDNTPSSSPTDLLPPPTASASAAAKKKKNKKKKKKTGGAAGSISISSAVDLASPEDSSPGGTPTLSPAVQHQELPVPEEQGAAAPEIPVGDSSSSSSHPKPPAPPSPPPKITPMVTTMPAAADLITGPATPPVAAVHTTTTTDAQDLASPGPDFSSSSYFNNHSTRVFNDDDEEQPDFGLHSTGTTAHQHPMPGVPAPMPPHTSSMFADDAELGAFEESTDPIVEFTTDEPPQPTPQFTTDAPDVPPAEPETFIDDTIEAGAFDSTATLDSVIDEEGREHELEAEQHQHAAAAASHETIHTSAPAAANVQEHMSVSEHVPNLVLDTAPPVISHDAPAPSSLSPTKGVPAQTSDLFASDGAIGDEEDFEDDAFGIGPGHGEDYVPAPLPESSDGMTAAAMFADDAESAAFDITADEQDEGISPFQAGMIPAVEQQGQVQREEAVVPPPAAADAAPEPVPEPVQATPAPAEPTEKPVEVTPKVVTPAAAAVTTAAAVAAAAALTHPATPPTKSEERVAPVKPTHAPTPPHKSEELPAPVEPTPAPIPAPAPAPAPVPAPVQQATVHASSLFTDDAEDAFDIPAQEPAPQQIPAELPKVTPMAQQQPARSAASLFADEDAAFDIGQPEHEAATIAAQVPTHSAPPVLASSAAALFGDDDSVAFDIQHDDYNQNDVQTRGATASASTTVPAAPIHATAPAPASSAAAALFSDESDQLFDIGQAEPPQEPEHAAAATRTDIVRASTSTTTTTAKTAFQVEQLGDRSIDSMFSDSDWLVDTTFDNSLDLGRDDMPPASPIETFDDDAIDAALAAAKQHTAAEPDLEVPQGWYDDNGGWNWYTDEEREQVRIAMLGDTPGWGGGATAATTETLAAPAHSENAARRTPEPTPAPAADPYAPAAPATGDPYAAAAAPPANPYAPAAPANPYAPVQQQQQPYQQAGAYTTGFQHAAPVAPPFAPAIPAAQGYASAYTPAAPAAAQFDSYVSAAAVGYGAPATGGYAAISQPPAPPSPKKSEPPKRMTATAYDPPVIRKQKSFARSPSVVQNETPGAFIPDNAPPVPALPTGFGGPAAAHPAAPPPGPPKRSKTQESVGSYGMTSPPPAHTAQLPPSGVDPHSHVATNAYDPPATSLSPVHGHRHGQHGPAHAHFAGEPSPYEATGYAATGYAAQAQDAYAPQRVVSPPLATKPPQRPATASSTHPPKPTSFDPPLRATSSRPPSRHASRPNFASPPAGGAELPPVPAIPAAYAAHAAPPPKVLSPPAMVSPPLPSPMTMPPRGPSRGANRHTPAFAPPPAAVGAAAATAAAAAGLAGAAAAHHAAHTQAPPTHAAPPPQRAATPPRTASPAQSAPMRVVSPRGAPPRVSSPLRHEVSAPPMPPMAAVAAERTALSLHEEVGETDPEGGSWQPADDEPEYHPPPPGRQYEDSPFAPPGPLSLPQSQQTQSGYEPAPFQQPPSQQHQQQRASLSQPKETATSGYEPAPFVPKEAPAAPSSGYEPAPFVPSPPVASHGGYEPTPFTPPPPPPPSGQSSYEPSPFVPPARTTSHSQQGGYEPAPFVPAPPAASHSTYEPHVPPPVAADTTGYEPATYEQSPTKATLSVDNDPYAAPSANDSQQPAANYNPYESSPPAPAKASQPPAAEYNPYAPPPAAQRQASTRQSVDEYNPYAQKPAAPPQKEEEYNPYAQKALAQQEEYNPYAPRQSTESTRPTRASLDYGSPAPPRRSSDYGPAGRTSGEYSRGSGEYSRPSGEYHRGSLDYARGQNAAGFVTPIHEQSPYGQAEYNPYALSSRQVPATGTRTMSPQIDLSMSPPASGNYFQGMHIDPTYVPQQVLEQRPVSEDPLGRCAAPSRNVPLAVFGFGGVVIMGFPGTASDSPDAPSYGYASHRGLLTIRPLAEVVESASANDGPSAFPGPLILDSSQAKGAVGDKKKREAVLAYLAARGEEIERGLPYLKSGVTHARRAERRTEEAKLAIVGILTGLIEGEGRLFGSQKAEDALRAALAPPASNEARAPSINGLGAHRATGARANGPQLEQLSSMIMSGSKKDAALFAASAGLWSHALVISSSVDPELWREIVTRFATAELESSPGTAGLKAAYSVYSGLTPATVDDLVKAANITEDPGADAWREVVRAVIFNGKPTDLVCLDDLGARFKRAGLHGASQVCFLLSPNSPFNDMSAGAGERPVPLTDMSLEDDGAIFAEIAEYARTLVPTPKGAEAPQSTLVQLLPYKLARAWRAAELGRVDEAKRYCEAIEAATKPVGKQAPIRLSRHLAASMEDLLERLTGEPSVDPSAGIGMRKSKSTATIGSWIEGRLTKFIAGDEDAPPAKPAAAPAKGSTAIGPFSHFSSISPGPSSGVSRNPSTVDLTVHIAGGSSLDVPMTSPFGNNATASATDAYAPSTSSYSGGYQPWDGDGSSPTDTSKSAEPVTMVPTLNINEDTSGFINPMAASMNFGTPAPAAAEWKPKHRQQTAVENENEDDDDLGFGNAALSRNRTPNADAASGSGTGDGKKPTPTPTASGSSHANHVSRPSTDSVAGSDAGGGAKEGKKGWFGGWGWGKKQPNLQEGAAGPSGTGYTKANLGDESSMVYDPDLKRWIVRGAKPDAAPTSSTPPPPRAQTTSPAGLSRPTPAARAMSATPVPSGGPPSGSGLPPSRQSTSGPVGGGLPPSGGPPGARPPTGGPPSGSGTPKAPAPASLDDLLSRPSSGRPTSAAAAKKKRANKYVDVFQPE